MRKFFANQRGAVSGGLTILFLITSLLGLAAGYKAVQQPTNIVPKAQQLKCTELTQYPNRKCEDTLPGPCNYGAWEYKCTETVCPTDSTIRVGIPFWCDGSVWHNMNYYGECTNACPALSQPSPTPGVCSGKPDGTIINSQVRKDCDTTIKKCVWVERYCQSGQLLEKTGREVTGWYCTKHEDCRGTAPVPTLTSAPQPTGSCFWINALFNLTKDGDFDAWVVFNAPSYGGPSHHISLFKDGVHLAGPDLWHKSGSRDGPFTYEPGQYTGGRIPAGSTVTFRGRDDECGTTGNISSVTCTLNKDGTVSGTGCGYRFGAPVQLPTNTPVPTIRSTNTPIPTKTPTPIPPIMCQEDPTLCIPPPITCVIVEGPEPHCVSPTPTPSPTSRLSPTSTPRIPTPGKQENIPQGGPLQTVEQLKEKALEVLQGKPSEKKIEEKPTKISGKVKVNNTLELGVIETYVSLYQDDNEKRTIVVSTVDSSGNYSFEGLTNPSYIIKAWVRTSDGNLYQNRPCTLASDDYDCKVKPGETKDLTVDIGPQGARLLMEKGQATFKKFMEGLERIPVVGPLLGMFLISAF